MKHFVYKTTLCDRVSHTSVTILTELPRLVQRLGETIRILHELRAESEEIILGILRNKKDFQTPVSLSICLSLCPPLTK
jgi:hypothetical protein